MTYIFSTPPTGWFYMQGLDRISGSSQQDLYTQVTNFRTANSIPIGNLVTDVDSFLASLFMLPVTSIPPAGWNYLQGAVMIVSESHGGLYKAVADYRIKNGITLGDYQGDIETYISSLPASISLCLKQYRTCCC